MTNGAQIAERLAKTRLLVLGDVMLDVFVRGSVCRVSPEAAVLIMDYRHEEAMLGGAGNAARNARSLNSPTTLVGVRGDDDQGDQLDRALEASGVSSKLAVLRNHPTTTKTRFLGANQHLLRVDRERYAELSEEVRNDLLQKATGSLADVDAVLVSDYAKGVVTDALVQPLIAAARHAGKPVVVDPKGHSFEKYRGCTVLTPNLRETCIAAGLSERDAESANLDLNETTRKLRDVVVGSALLVTRGAQGMTLFDGSAHHLDARAQQVFDVSGAGDTVAATLALGIGAGLPLIDAARIANLAASLVVSQPGTATVDSRQLAQLLDG